VRCSKCLPDSRDCGGRLPAGEENLRLERKVAAVNDWRRWVRWPHTVAHEVKNPLSAIKSIAQVMSEDEALKQSARARSEFNRGRD